MSDPDEVGELRFRYSLNASHLQSLQCSAEEDAEFKRASVGAYKEVAGLSRKHDRLMGGIDSLISKRRSGLAQAVLEDETDSDPSGYRNGWGSRERLPTILTALVMLQQVIKVDKSPAPILDSLTGVYASAVACRLEDLSIDDYVEHSRRSLTRSIGSTFSRNTGTLVVYLLDTEFERKIATAVNVGKEIRRELIEGIRAETSHLPRTVQMPLLLVSVDSRSRMQQALFPEYRRMSVLSYGDLDAEMNIQPVARISPPPARR
jgi:hypothetical protein